jgi:GntR family transcriptional repressor for pyruvate dehydrogenase complex
MKASLKPIKAKRISDQVFEQLRDLIYQGELRPGDQVLPERDLSVALGVSRTTVRDAINRLVVLGLLEHKQGQGTFVSNPDAKTRHPLAAAMSIELEGATLEDLLEVRMGLECNAAALAASRATEEDIKRMMDCLEAMEVAFRQKGENINPDGDAAFHMAIAYATKNPVHTYIMKNFHDFLFVGIRENLRLLYEDPKNIEDVLEQHRKVFSAIRRRDPEMATSAMKMHIRYVMLFFRDHSRRDLLDKIRVSGSSTGVVAPS